MAFNGELFGQAVVEAVTKSIQPLKDRIETLEKELAERNHVVGAHIDRDGALNLTFSNGSEKNLGIVTTKGEPGKDGIDGKDGFSLTAFDAQMAEDGRTIEFAFEDEHHKASASLTLPVPIYKGIWSEGSYQKADMVTHAGSLFAALTDTDQRPGTADWQLAAKRGRDAR